MVTMSEKYRANLEHPKISELIEILFLLKKKYGDVRVAGAYDGGWYEDVYVQIFQGYLIIGSIS